MAVRRSVDSFRLHRLNRTDCQNAVRDELAIDIDATSPLSGDDAASGFDDIGDFLKPLICRADLSNNRIRTGAVSSADSQVPRRRRFTRSPSQST
jgi:hypothetical protein